MTVGRTIYEQRANPVASRGGDERCNQAQTLGFGSLSEPGRMRCVARCRVESTPPPKLIDPNESSSSIPGCCHCGAVSMDASRHP